MLICQQPLTEMTISLDCCTDVRIPGLPDPHTPPITSSTGIKIGQILDSVKALQKSHRYCPYASELKHDWDGTVRPQVQFTASLELRGRDPIIMERLRDQNECDTYAGELGRKIQVLSPYVRAKHTGKILLLPKTLNVY